MKSAPVIRNKKTSIQNKLKKKSFPVVAIGASAGGIEAMTVLLKNLPPDTGMAYIYVQHLSPDHKSFLTSILSKTTKMKVKEIVDMEAMKPNTVYVIPFNKAIEVTDGHIKLIPRKKGGKATSIDILFSSLAKTHKKNVIGIVLSGNASDGTYGMKAIKEEGGITIAQDSSAQASGMPQSAITADVVDFVLSPKEIARKLISLSKNNFLKQTVERTAKVGAVDDNNQDLKAVFEILLKKTGVDFSHYKMTTVTRRLKHRMFNCNVKTIKEYAKLLENDPEETKKLCRNLLVNVTYFFRDTEVFKYLKTSLLPKLLAGKKNGETLRIWVPSCSTGQEAYSIAMLIAELQGKTTKKIPVKIFATDVSEQTISTARIGEFSQSDIESVSKARLKKFFTKTRNHYQIIKEIREMCVFATHNILRDPSFFRMDLISCRNLLIYFDAAAQKKALASIHFALNDDGGYLLLGKAETAGASAPFFTSVNNKLKIYTREKDTTIRTMPELSPHFPRTIISEKNIKPSSQKKSDVDAKKFDSAIDSALLSSYMPACAIINKEMEILQFRGSTSVYLSHPSGGKASLNILKMTRPEFAFELRNAIYTAFKTNQSVHKTGIEIKIDNIFRMMTLDVSPLKIDWDEPLLLVVFTMQEEVKKYISTGKSGKNNLTQKDLRIKKLVEELTSVQTEMKTVIESQEASYQELLVANEEIIASNEEFQTMTEELETSKEEIQASNEELISTVQELKMQNLRLDESYNYSEAIIATIHVPMLVLDNNFNVKSANKSFYKKFIVTEEETIGKPLFELGDKQWNIPILYELLTDTLLKKVDFKNFSVTHSFPEIGEKTMLLNARLIIQKDRSEKLILLAIEDITERDNYYLKEKYARNLIEASLDPLVTINIEGKITDMNGATVNIIGISRENLIGSDFFEYFTEPQKAYEVYQEAFAKGAVSDSQLTIRDCNGKLTNLLFNGSVYKDDLGFKLGVVFVARDVTERRRIEENLENSLKEVSDYKYALDESSIVAVTDQNGTIKYANDNFCKISKYSLDELIGQDAGIINSRYHAKEFIRDLWSTITDGKIWRGELRNKAKDGSIYWVDTTIVPFLDKFGKPYQYVTIKTDITQRKIDERELLEAKVSAEEAKCKAEDAANIAKDAVKAKQQFLSNMSHEIRTPMNAIIGFTNVVLKTKLDKKQKEYLNAIKVSGDNLVVLINDILDLAKVDAGKMTLEQIPFKLSASISTVIHLLEIKSQEKNIEIVKEYDNALPEILLGDPLRLNQIMLNLLGNAVKFTSKGKIIVSVRMLNEDDEKVSVEFVIKDTGIGISENLLENIFDSFQQATSETSRLYGGTGLGLAIVKKLITIFGGTISVKSKLGKGSTFTFILTFKKTKEKPEEVIEILAGAVAGVGAGVKVLIVEDIVLNQFLMKTLLEDFGFESEIAGNGRIAVEKLQKNKYDIILMDLQMPEMNGFEATKYIRNKMKSQIPIIALSADVTTVDVEKCKAIGMNDYIAKPVNDKLLYSKIMGLLKTYDHNGVNLSLNVLNKTSPKNKRIKREDNIRQETASAFILQSPKQKCINLDYLREITKSNSGIIEMIEVYLEETPQLIITMKKSMEDNDWESLRIAAHSIRPSFSMLGMDKEFESSAKKIQEYATILRDGYSGKPAYEATWANRTNREVKELFSKIENICTLACEELKRELIVLKAD